MGELYLLTGEIHSGKTTALLQWSEKRNDVYGILSPVVNGRRMFMNISTKEFFEMEAKGDKDILEIGRYRFSISSFQKASGILLSAKDKKGWLVIDEIGPLELKKEGFYKALDKILNSLDDKSNLILLIRTPILQQVIDFFELNRFSPEAVTTDFFN